MNSTFKKNIIFGSILFLYGSHAVAKKTLWENCSFLDKAKEAAAFFEAHKGKKGDDALWPSTQEECCHYGDKNADLNGLLGSFLRKSIYQCSKNKSSVKNEWRSLLPFKNMNSTEAKELCKQHKCTFIQEVEEKYSGKSYIEIPLCTRVEEACFYSDTHYTFKSKELRIDFIYYLLLDDYKNLVEGNLYRNMG